ncbi:CocE/NonD family hydrolase [Nonomuraea sp. B12E4]|uniref:CocE/NonD family hydrolase n=1 Tax=Nonomuraea sp. B12E4 TaxID=3153564 RepID=UPI00325CD984
MYIDTNLSADPPTKIPRPASSYVTMTDGTRLAVDLWTWDQHQRRPTIVWLTRYWRRSTGAKPVSETFRDAIAYFTDAGYAFLVVDVRGTGASFGTRPTEWAPEEIEDYGTIIRWAADQPWSNGAVATLGTSYPGNAAELAAIASDGALRAVVPRFTDFTEYLHAFRPGGLVNTVISDTWIALTQALDRNNDPAAPELADALPPGDSVAPVDGDDGTLLAEAVAEHRANGDLRQVLEVLEHSDDPFTAGDLAATLEDVSISGLWPKIDARRVPSMHWASWYDGGTADSVITRFLTYHTPIVGITGAWNHGASTNANPFGARDEAPPEPSRAAQYAAIDAFLRPLLGDEPGSPPEQVLEYFTVGADTWRTTTTWPPAGHKPWNLFLAEGNSLTSEASPADGVDIYQVELATTTGIKNRWHTQLGAPLDYGDRRRTDEALLVYDSAPLDSDLELTGTPIANLQIALDGHDAAIFTYLESVAPDGTVTMLSDGRVRLSLAGSERDDATYPGPTPTFTKATRNPAIPGEQRLVRITLHPLSALVPRGHRLRFAVAGADAETFSPLPADQASTRITIHREPQKPSYVSVPRISDPRTDSETKRRS